MEPGSPQPSYEELLAIVLELHERVERLEAENAELPRRLGMNSTNSSKPPSADQPCQSGRNAVRQGWSAAW